MDLKEFKEAVKARIDIAEVIGKHISLNKNGIGLCPFHDDKKPSLSVNTKSQYFYCFGCGIGGDVFKFLELYTHRPFMEILKELANRAGMKMPEVNNEHRGHILKEREIEDILSETAAFYHKSLTPEAVNYLIKARGIKEELIDRFQIGFAGGGLRKHLLKICKFSQESCIASGVLKLNDEKTIYDVFYNRVIFPNIVRGRVVYLTGRSINGKEPKYLNLSKELLYLYNEDAIDNEVFITEGIIDSFSLIGNGYSAVSICGTNNFKPIFKDKFKNCRIIYICLDGDAAGKNASVQIGSLLGDKAKIITLPENLDPNEFFLTNTKEDFEELKKSALDLIKYKISQIPADTEKTELAEKLNPVLEEIEKSDPSKQSAYLEYIKKLFKLKAADIDGYKKQIKKYKKEKESTVDSNEVNQAIYSANFKELVDLVEEGGSSAYLIKRENEIYVTSQFERDGNIFIPPPIDKIPFKLARADKVLDLFELHKGLSQEESDKTIYESLLYYHKSISELPQEEYYDLIVCWDFHTYLFEYFQHSPFVCLFAIPERGKSRTGKAMVFVAYRGVWIESLNEPHIIRLSKDFNASIFFDVVNIWKKAEESKSIDIILSRFEKGLRVPRVLYPERGPFQDTVYFTTFGPTVIGTNAFAHDILNTRAIIINMISSSKKFDIDVSEENALPYKESLVVFRAKHMGKPLPEYKTQIYGRLGNITKPLLQIIRMVNPDREGILIDLIKKIEVDRILEKTDSVEGRILNVVASLKEEVNGGILPVKTITDEYNKDINSERFKITYQKVGRRLTAMGFEKVKTGNGSSAIVWNDKNIEKLFKEYGLELTPETQETPETPAKIKGISGVTDVSDVLF